MLSRKKNLTPQNEVILRNVVVQRVNEAKFLGVIVDQRINWKDHISMISQNISKSCGIIYRIRNTLDIKSKRLIYYGLIHPYLTYCLSVWSSMHIELILKCYVLHKIDQCVHYLPPAATALEGYFLKSKNFPS